MYRTLGNQDYEVLYQFMQDHDLPAALSINLLSGANRGSEAPWGYVNSMKQGKFKVKGLEEAREIMSKADVFTPYISRIIRRSRGFIMAVSSLTHSDKFDWERMVRKLEESPILIRYSVSKKEYLYQLEKIYNYGSKVTTRIF